MLQESAVVHQRLLAVAGFVLEQPEVVVRFGIAGIDCQCARERAPGVIAAPRLLLDSGEIHERFDIPRVYRQRRMKLRRGCVELPLTEIHDAEIVPRPRITRVDGDRPLEFLDRIVKQTLITIEQTEIVVGFGVQLIALKQLLVVKQRVLEVAQTLVVHRVAEMILANADRRRVCTGRGRQRRPRRRSARRGGHARRHVRPT